MKRRLLVALLVASSLLTSSTALARPSRHQHHANGAAQGGDPNKGDVWVDTVLALSSGPGHEMDPHLPCANINLWGAKLADSSGPYTIDGWPPSGSMKQAYSGTWHYDKALGGSQKLD